MQNISGNKQFLLPRLPERLPLPFFLKEVHLLNNIKNPVVAEFLGFSQNTDFTESDLEKSILSNLQKFLMELGKHLVFHNKLNHVIINQ